MDNLRLILLIIGSLIVLGIYLWEVFKNNPPSKKTDILNAVDDVPDTYAPLINTNDVAIDDYVEDTLADLGSLLTKLRNQDINLDNIPGVFPVSKTGESIKDAEKANLPVDISAKNDEIISNENIKSDIYVEEKIEKEKTDLRVDDEQQEKSAQIDKTEVRERNKSSENLLVLYITSPSQMRFNGLSISKAAEEVGMVYGDMNIFHHFGQGKLHCGQPLFSFANIHEPGSFDLECMADLKTKGLAIFMYSPVAIDTSVVFELFLNTAQRLAKLLGGIVRAVDNKILDDAAINILREKAKSFANEQ